MIRQSPGARDIFVEKKVTPSFDRDDTARARGGRLRLLVFLERSPETAGPRLYLNRHRGDVSRTWCQPSAPIFLIVFAIPAAAALFVWWKLRSSAERWSKRR
jgi:hypothetical protein